jgi:hypothetical protein
MYTIHYSTRYHQLVPITILDMLMLSVLSHHYNREGVGSMLANAIAD